MSQNSIKKQSNSKAHQNIKVFVRIRPFNSKQDPQRGCIVSSNQKNISVKQREAKEPHSFTFDGIFDSYASQPQVYDVVGSQIVASAFNGLNGTIFCYGQTSSGKTHTCIGPDFRDEKLSGLVPRLIKQTLLKIQNRPKNIDAKMKMSIVEIYNEKIKDLLDPTKNDLKIRSNKKQGIFLENLTEKYVLSQQEGFNYLNIGIHNRSVSATNMNSQSSRSHMVFIINLITHNVYTGQAKSAKITLVDLAGSQKISKTGAEGKVLQQAKKINTSLTALGKVINTLSDGKNAHVPYRDSKLTRLLQQSLGGNSLTNLIVNVSPSTFNEYETITSIRFGQRAKSIKNEPIVNKTYTIEQLLELLKKAEETIYKQNLLIKELSTKKRTGGYGALSIPQITLQYLPDDQDAKTNRSIDCESQQQDNNRYKQNEQKSQTFSLVSSGNIEKQQKNHYLSKIRTQQQLTQDLSRPTAHRSLQKCQTFNTFPKNAENFEDKINLSKTQDNFLPRKRCESLGYQSFNQQPTQLKQRKLNANGKRKQVNGIKKLNINQIILQDSQQNSITPRNIVCGRQKKKDSSFFDGFFNAEDNFEKIRKNLFELKLRYMQQKKQNSLKSMIIERKNRIIQKVKNSQNSLKIR